jgi:hypothetical protein
MWLGLAILLLFLPYAALPNLRTGMAENEILEAVFRHQIEHCYEARSPKLYFLSYKGQDLTDEFMEGFKNHEPRIRKRSQQIGFKDKETGERGILLSVANINHRSKSKAGVRATCGVASMDAYSYFYQVMLRKGKWRVKSSKLIGVS